MFTYKATCRRVIDGDTIVVDIDLGFNITYADVALRLYGINTPELKSKDPAEKLAARAAKERVQELLPEGSTILVKTIKDEKEKFGRYLALVFDPNDREINKLLLEEGLAQHYE